MMKIQQHWFMLRLGVERQQAINYRYWPISMMLYVIIGPDEWTYRQVSNISGTLVGNQIVGHWDVVGASPVGAAPTTSLFST